MFVNIILIDTRSFGIAKYKLIDTDFKEEVLATDLLNCFRQVYEPKSVDIARYLVRFIMWWEKTFHKTDIFEYAIVSKYNNWIEYLDLHREGLERYMLLK